MQFRVVTKCGMISTDYSTLNMAVDFAVSFKKHPEKTEELLKFICNGILQGLESYRSENGGLARGKVESYIVKEEAELFRVISGNGLCQYKFLGEEIVNQYKTG